jgi:hypothetical protein
VEADLACEAAFACQHCIFDVRSDQTYGT